MSYEVRLTPEAAWDLVRLSSFLAERTPESAERAGEVIKSAIRSLAEFPHRGRPIATVRELVAPLGRYAYVVVYRVDREAVVVARVYHSHEQR